MVRLVQNASLCSGNDHTDCHCGTVHKTMSRFARITLLICVTRCQFSSLWDSKVLRSLRFSHLRQLFPWKGSRGCCNCPPALPTLASTLFLCWDQDVCWALFLHHSLFVGFAEGAYGQGVLVWWGVGRQGNLQLHFLVCLLPSLEKMHVVAHRHLRNKKASFFSTAGKGRRSTKQTPFADGDHEM